MELIFWKYMLCHLQSSYIRELSATSGVRVSVIVDREMENGRAEQGWLVPDFGKARIEVTQDRKRVREIIASSSPDSIHILNGYRDVKLLGIALRELLRSDRHFGLLAEPGVSVGLKGLVGPAMYRLHCLRFWNRFDFVLAIGTRGADWFRARGYPQQKTFPFAYITETYRHLAVANGGDGGTVQLIFVGQLIPRKGLDLALRALGRLRDANWKLSVIGCGPRQKTLQALARKLSISDKVTFLGAMKNEEVTNRLKTADLLILPSRYDGWGAVTNEALMCGVPVLCSHQCGAQDLLDAPDRGEVFRAGSVPDLHAALSRRMARGKLKDCERERIREWSRCISGRPAADYFLTVMRHVYDQAPRPVAPWL